MTDREKVLKGLEHCIARYIDGLCDDCPYMGELDKSYMIPMKCKEIIMRDALAMLKEQESIIEVLKSDLQETLDVVANRGNVVRCKDCKNRNSWECWQYFFGRMNLPDDYYCADGKPKDGEK